VPRFLSYLPHRSPIWIASILLYLYGAALRGVSCEILHSYKTVFGFAVANVLLLHQGQELRDEKCSNSSVKNEQILKSGKKWRPYSYSGRSFFDDGSGCPMSSEENESLETIDSVLLMTANDDLVPDFSERNDMVCSRVANFGYRILFVAVNGDKKVITLQDALKSRYYHRIFDERKRQEKVGEVFQKGAGML
jgi:hypothetical protein